MGLVEEFNEKICKAFSILWLQMFNKYFPIGISMIIIYALILQLRIHSDEYLLYQEPEVMSKTQSWALW